MITEKERYECEILAIFAKVKLPVGSGILSSMLKELNFDLSEASVGRLLGEMDRKGWTQKLGYQGRILTETGKKRLRELRVKKKRILYSDNFFNSLDVKKKENLIEVLEARRVIEGELARLAAKNVGNEDIEIIRKIYLAQAKQAALGKVTTEQDVNFHRSIAKAAKNRVLAAALDLIQQDGQVFPYLEYIRSHVGGIIVVEHNKIMEAIINKKPEEAEKRMVEHIESLIADVEKYWEIVLEKKENF